MANKKNVDIIYKTDKLSIEQKKELLINAKKKCYAWYCVSYDGKETKVFQHFIELHQNKFKELLNELDNNSDLHIIYKIYLLNPILQIILVNKKTIESGLYICINGKYLWELTSNLDCEISKKIISEIGPKRFL